GVVVEIDVDVAQPLIFAPLTFPRPAPDSLIPEIQGRPVIAAGIELVGAMQAQIEEIGGDFLKAWPVRRIGDDERRAGPAQQLDEASIAETLMPHFEGMADRRRGRRREERAPGHDPAVALPGEL